MEQDNARGLIHSLEFYMNPAVFRSDDALRRISESLVAGRLVVIRNAATDVFAEKMFQCLDTFQGWRVYEGYEDHFHYHHHNIYDKALYPPELAWCNAIFASGASRDLAQRLSQRDCSGETSFSASLYLPGDFSLPHNDDVTTGEGTSRQVAFVWHLTKNWRPTWGGDFYWCPANRYFAPVFNTLLLFTVGKDSNHFVTHVSPFARSKRLAINGWWTGKDGSRAAGTRGGKSYRDEWSEMP
jgi:hypothetical protein